MADLDARVHDLAAPLVADVGLELLEVEVKGGGRHRLVRVVVDRHGGVDLAACEQISRRLSAALDDADPVPGGYRLEVTSPGVDRPLVDQRAFSRVVGRDVLVHRDAGDGRVLQVEGSVVAAEADAVVLGADEGHRRIPYAEIVTARQRLPW